MSWLEMTRLQIQPPADRFAKRLSQVSNAIGPRCASARWGLEQKMVPSRVLAPDTVVLGLAFGAAALLVVIGILALLA